MDSLPVYRTTSEAAGFVSALLKGGPWVLLALAAWAAIAQYGNARAAEALALARADSIVWAQERHDSLEISRDRIRQELQKAVDSLDRDRDSLQVVAQEADSSSQANLGRLAAILADTARQIPDTVRVVVLGAIAGLERERDVCQAQLSTCEATRIDLEGRIRLDSISIVEKDSLLEAFDDQLESAIAQRRHACGLVCWGTRAVAVYGIFTIGSDLIGGKQ